jgi:F0F1-type ATP synthase assembly protein I
MPTRKPSSTRLVAIMFALLVVANVLLLIFASSNSRGFVYGSACILITVAVFGTPLFVLARWKWQGERPSQVVLRLVIVWLVLDLVLVLVVVAFFKRATHMHIQP